jgi:hypothetical protein
MCSGQFADLAKFAELKQSFQKRECRELRASCAAGNACTDPLCVSVAAGAVLHRALGS